MGSGNCMARKSWQLDFQAEPEEVAALRRITRMHLGLWGLPDLIEAAQLCVSELVTNVIRHVGVGTPSTLAVSMRGTNLRIEVHDPDGWSLPARIDGGPDAESGRGMALVEAMAERWGVAPDKDGKATWCELATDLAAPEGHAGGLRVDQTEALLDRYEFAGSTEPEAPPATAARRAEEGAVSLITDVLHWLRLHGRDADQALDNARERFAEMLPDGGCR